MKFEHIKAVIFDLDGTLVDSALDFAAMCDEIGWARGTPLLEQLALVDNVNERQRIEAIIQRHEIQGAENATWMPGAEDCLHQLAQARRHIAILTRNMRLATEITMARLQIPVSTVLTREDCAAKPDPQGLILLAERFQLERHQMIYVGDYKFDLQTAANAGVASCLYLNQQNQQYAVDADWSFNHFEQLTSALLG